MKGNARNMRTFKVTSLFIYVFILLQVIADNVFGTKHHDFSSKIVQSGIHALRNVSKTDINREKENSDQGKFTNKNYEYNHSNERQKRSVFPDYSYGLRLLAGLNTADRIKRLHSDYGYGSRLQAGENVANSYEHQGLFGVAGPGKRNYDVDFNMLTNAEKLAKLLAASKIFSVQRQNKRISSDFGYGSREQAAENLAKLFAKEKVFGVYGPGKRSFRYRQGTVPDEEHFRKRFSSDFGYGSREQAAENLARSFAKGKVFGVYGPGKRSGLERNIRGGEVEADSGYGSRIQAGSQIAKDVVAINNLFGLLGPGRR